MKHGFKAKKITFIVFLTLFILNSLTAQGSIKEHDEQFKLEDIKPISVLNLTVYQLDEVESRFALYAAEKLETIGFSLHVQFNTQSEFLTNLANSNFDLAMLTFQFRMNGSPTVQEEKNIFETIIDNISFFLAETFISGGHFNFFNLDSTIPFYNQSLSYLQSFSSDSAILDNLENWYAWQELVMDKILPFIPVCFQTVVKNNTEIGQYSVLAFNLNSPYIGGINNTQFLTQEGYEDYSKALAVRKAMAYSINRSEFYDYFLSEDYPGFHTPFPVEFFSYPYSDIVKYNYNYSEALKWLELAGYNTEDRLYFSIKHPKYYVMLTLIYFLSLFSVVFDFYLYKKQQIYIPFIKTKQVEKEVEEEKFTEDYYVTTTLKKLSASVFFYFSIIHLIITIVTTVNEIIPTLIEGREIRIYSESFFGLTLSNLINLWFIPLAFLLSLWNTVLVKRILERSEIKTKTLKIYYAIPLFNLIYFVAFFIIALEIALVMTK